MAVTWQIVPTISNISNRCSTDFKRFQKNLWIFRFLRHLDCFMSMLHGFRPSVLDWYRRRRGSATFFPGDFHISSTAGIYLDTTIEALGLSMLNQPATQPTVWTWDLFFQNGPSVFGLALDQHIRACSIRIFPAQFGAGFSLVSARSQPEAGLLSLTTQKLSLVISLPRPANQLCLGLHLIQPEPNFGLDSLCLACSQH